MINLWIALFCVITMHHCGQSIHSAAINGDIQAIKRILSEGQDINAVDDEGATALWLAAGTNKEDTVRFLLSKGADPNVKVGGSGRTALHNAALEGHASLVRLLVNGNANVNATSSSWTTPLHDAVFSEDIVTAGILLKNGAKPNWSGQGGVTPIFMASDPAMVMLLILNGAKLDILTSDDVSPLIAFTVDGRDELVETLLLLDATIDFQNNNGDTALLYLVDKLAHCSQSEHRNLMRCFELLLKNGADPYLENCKGESAYSLSGKYNLDLNFRGVKNSN